MSEQTFIIEFGGASTAEANMYAGELRDTLLDAAPEASVEPRRNDGGAMDFGATLAIVLAGPAVVALAKALGDWLKMHREVSVDITTPDGKVVAKNLTSEDALKIVELMQGGGKG